MGVMIYSFARVLAAGRPRLLPKVGVAEATGRNSQGWLVHGLPRRGQRAPATSEMRAQREGPAARGRLCVNATYPY